MSNELPVENLTPEHLLTLFQISGWINSTLDFDQALDNAIDAVMQVAHAERGFLVIHDEEKKTLEVLVARGIDGQTIEEEGYSTTIVNQVVETREPILTNNAQFDTRFSPGQSIIMRGLRAILCSPMLVQDRLIGVVYMDTSMKTGTFRPNDLALIKAVSGLAARAIENARLYQVAIEKGRLEHELNMASEIQRNLLPNTMPQMRGYDISPYWKSAREVAGDFYDAFELGGNTFATVIADVSDKGAPAALFMAVARTLIRSHAHAGLDPVATMRKTNDLLIADAEQSGMFVTVFYSLFGLDGRSSHVCGGHNPPAYYRAANQDVVYLPTGGRALGWFPDNPVELVDLQLHSGDVIVFYTDGLTEAENPEGEPYGEARLSDVLARVASKTTSAEQIRDAILDDVAIFADGQLPFDDLTMLIVSYRS